MHRESLKVHPLCVPLFFECINFHESLWAVKKKKNILLVKNVARQSLMYQGQHQQEYGKSGISGSFV